jgi:hypothetical protein
MTNRFGNYIANRITIRIVEKNASAQGTSAHHVDKMTK